MPLTQLQCSGCGSTELTRTDATTGRVSSVERPWGKRPSPSKEKPSKTTSSRHCAEIHSSVALNQDATDKLGVLNESESMLLWSLAAPPTRRALLAATAAQTASKQEAKRIASNPHTPSQVLQNPQPDLSNLLANNPNTPEPTLLLLLKKRRTGCGQQPEPQCA